MQFDTIIRGGTIVTAADTFVADLGISDGVIAALGLGLGEAPEIIDATCISTRPPAPESCRPTAF
jgi:dihydropyrimidinase